MDAVPAEEQCLTGDVRLVNGSTKLAGRLEVCFNEVWGTVCRFGWTAPTAAVVCQQLGFDSSGVEMQCCSIIMLSAVNATNLIYIHVLIGAIGVTTPMFGVGASTDPILLSNVNCSGQEKNISECNHSGVNNVFFCGHGDDVGVICEGECTICNIHTKLLCLTVTASMNSHYESAIYLPH